MINPSSKWTDGERLKAITAILNEVPKEKVLSQLATSKINDIWERIRFLASATPQFLEANRKGILEGQS